MSGLVRGREGSSARRLKSIIRSPPGRLFHRLCPDGITRGGNQGKATRKGITPRSPDGIGRSRWRGKRAGPVEFQEPPCRRASTGVSSSGNHRPPAGRFARAALSCSERMDLTGLRRLAALGSATGGGGLPPLGRGADRFVQCLRPAVTLLSARAASRIGPISLGHSVSHA